MTASLLGLPHDRNSSFLPGAASAPSAIRAALKSPSANMFCELGYDLAGAEYLRDAGDLPIESLGGQAAYDAIHAGVTGLLKGGTRIIALGGDHSVSFPAIMAHTQLHPKIDVLHFDAHPDLYDDFEGNPFSHASPFARLMESGRIGRLFQLGIRTANDHQREQAARFGVEQFAMHDLAQLPPLAFGGAFYVSIDLDALDPAFAPGVSHHEPGGLSVRQIIDCLHNVRGRLVGADIVELNPDRDINGMTAMVAAKLVKEVAGRMIADD